MKAYLLNLKVGRRKLKLHVMIIPPNDSFLYEIFDTKSSPFIEVTNRKGERVDTHWKEVKSPQKSGQYKYITTELNTDLK